ncbi:hypothetical protein PTKIN_Ptkin03bG0036400 [Pterospermum kingtungense]
MGEEVKMSEFEANGGDDEEVTATAAAAAAVDDEDDVDERVLEWEMGLPNCDDLTPLSQSLIPSELASTFSISPEPHRTALDVNRASQYTISSLRSTGAHSTTNNNNSKSKTNNNFHSFNDLMVVEPEGDGSGSGYGSDPKKMRKMDVAEVADSTVRTTENSDHPSARTLKRPRLVWTPQLHKRFVDVVAHLGIQNAVPKTIMQLMNSLHESGSGSGGGGGSGVGGGDGSVNGNGHMGMAILMPYGAPMMPVPMPMYGHVGMHHHHPQHQRQHHHPQNQNGYEANSYGMVQQRDWSAGGNKYGSVLSYPHHLAPNDKLN